jgi:hypothetical protein
VVAGIDGDVHRCVLPYGHTGKHSIGDPNVPGTLVWHTPYAGAPVE